MNDFQIMISKRTQYNYLQRSLKPLILLTFLSLITLSIVFVSGCKNDPNDLGINFVNPNDTLGSLLLESNADTIRITENNVRVYNNNSSVSSLLVGSSPSAAGTYQAKSFLTFTGLPNNRAGENVLSSYIRFKYNFYSYRDSAGPVSFNIYKVKRKLDYSTVTLDSVTSSDFETTQIGTYTGNPTDVSDIIVNLDPNAVKDWISYAADTNSTGKNYGIYISPNSGSTTIKGFYTSNDDINFRPRLIAIVDSNGTHDTLNISDSQYLSLTDAPLSVIPANRIFVQSGITFLSRVNFDFTKIPSNVIINEAYLELTIDPVNSVNLPFTSKSVFADRVTDSVLVKANADGFSTFPVAGDTTKYYVRLNSYFQGWSTGIYPREGILLSMVSKSNLNSIAFYDQSDADINKRPKLRIRYTNR